ncbi:hypothetical protein D3C73_721530 [compost metagenome]
MLMRTLQIHVSNESSEVSFGDKESIPAWAKAYVEAAREHGIVVGRAGNQFVPDGLTTRAEAAFALLRLWKIVH